MLVGIDDDHSHAVRIPDGTSAACASRRIGLLPRRASPPVQLIHLASSMAASHLLRLCQLRRNPLRHSHELTPQPLIGGLETEPVADLSMDLRQRHPPPIRSRGPSPPPSARTSPRLTLLPLAPDQETVGQHHTDRMAMKTRPQPPLILIPTQEPLGLLMILLHPMPSVGILHQTIQGTFGPKLLQ